MNLIRRLKKLCAKAAKWLKRSPYHRSIAVITNNGDVKDWERVYAALAGVARASDIVGSSPDNNDSLCETYADNGKLWLLRKLAVRSSAPEQEWRREVDSILISVPASLREDDEGGFDEFRHAAGFAVAAARDTKSLKRVAFVVTGCKSLDASRSECQSHVEPRRGESADDYLARMRASSSATPGAAFSDEGWANFVEDCVSAPAFALFFEQVRRATRFRVPIFFVSDEPGIPIASTALRRWVDRGKISPQSRLGHVFSVLSATCVVLCAVFVAASGWLEIEMMGDRHGDPALSDAIEIESSLRVAAARFLTGSDENRFHLLHTKQAVDAIKRIDRFRFGEDDVDLAEVLQNARSLEGELIEVVKVPYRQALSQRAKSLAVALVMNRRVIESREGVGLRPKDLSESDARIISSLRGSIIAEDQRSLDAIVTTPDPEVLVAAYEMRCDGEGKDARSSCSPVPAFVDLVPVARSKSLDWCLKHDVLGQIRRIRGWAMRVGIVLSGLDDLERDLRKALAPRTIEVIVNGPSDARWHLHDKVGRRDTIRVPDELGVIRFTRKKAVYGGRISISINYARQPHMEPGCEDFLRGVRIPISKKAQSTSVRGLGVVIRLEGLPEWEMRMPTGSLTESGNQMNSVEVSS